MKEALDKIISWAKVFKTENTFKSCVSNNYTSLTWEEIREISEKKILAPIDSGIKIGRMLVEIVGLVPMEKAKRKDSFLGLF